MYSIILLMLMAQITIASDLSDHSLVVRGDRSNAELDAILDELGLTDELPAVLQSHSKTKKSGNSTQLAAMGEATKHTCSSDGSCVKKECPSHRSVSDQEWKDKWENEAVEDMYGVQHYDVSRNYLISLPIIQDPSKSLTVFDVSYNMFTAIPDLSALVALKHLSFKGNRIKNLDLQQLPKGCLRNMDFENNKIETIAPIDDWRMEPGTINRIELAGNPLTRACLAQLAIAGKGSVFFLGLRGARKGFTNSGSIVGITPDEVRAAFSQSKGGAIELGRFNNVYDEKLNELRKCINPGKKSIINGGIRVIGHFCNDKSIRDLLPQFPYFDSTKSVKPLALTTGPISISDSEGLSDDWGQVSGALASSSRNFHDVETTDASNVMSIDRILNSVGEKSERAERSEEACDPKKRKAQRHTTQKHTTQKRIRKNMQGSNSLVTSFALTDGSSSTISESVEQLRSVIMSGSNSTSIPSFSDQSKTVEPVNASSPRKIVSIDDILNSEDVQPAGRDDFGDRFLSDVDNNSSDSTLNRIS